MTKIVLQNTGRMIASQKNVNLIVCHFIVARYVYES